jgi:diacylglycerol kinase family enzyme
VAQGNNNIKHLFILNPKSFWHKWKQTQVLLKIYGYFTTSNNSNYDVHISRFPRDAVGFIPQYAKSLPDNTILRVYAVGGDGILFDCLNGIIGIDNAELAVFPYGRTNNFIRGFGKNEKPFFRDVERLVNSPVVPMDVMRCGNNYALNYCVVGLEAEAVRYSEKIREKMNKSGVLNQWLSRQLYPTQFFMGGLAASFDKRLLYQQYEIEIDGEKKSGYYWTVSVFNGAYYGGKWHPCDTAMPNDGVLDILSTQGKRFLRMYSMFPRYVSGRYTSFPSNIIMARGQKICVRSGEILKVCMDGCLFYEPKLDIELLPAGVRFVDASRYGYLGGSND